MLREKKETKICKHLLNILRIMNDNPTTLLSQTEHRSLQKPPCSGLDYTGNLLNAVQGLSVFLEALSSSSSCSGNHSACICPARSVKRVSQLQWSSGSTRAASVSRHRVSTLHYYYNVTQYTTHHTTLHYTTHLKSISSKVAKAACLKRSLSSSLYVATLFMATLGASATFRAKSSCSTSSRSGMTGSSSLSEKSRAAPGPARARMDFAVLARSFSPHPPVRRAGALARGLLGSSSSSRMSPVFGRFFSGELDNTSESSSWRAARRPCFAPEDLFIGESAKVKSSMLSDIISQLVSKYYCSQTIPGIPQSVTSQAARHQEEPGTDLSLPDCLCWDRNQPATTTHLDVVVVMI